MPAANDHQVVGREIRPDRNCAFARNEQAYLRPIVCDDKPDGMPMPLEPVDKRARHSLLQIPSVGKDPRLRRCPR
jgi:hypothetical protein